MKLIAAALMFVASFEAQTPTQPQRIYVEESVSPAGTASSHCDAYGNCRGSAGARTRNVSLEVTKEIVRLCPDTLTVTDNRDAAAYSLRISAGSSTLYRQNGDVAYISPAKWKASNLAKDVCNYVAAHPAQSAPAN